MERLETHISRLYLTEDEVFKVKKPVNFGFLDFSTPELRHEACLAEVRLNRRLSPEVYLGVVPVSLASSGEPQFGGEGPAADWAVWMRRLPEDARGDRLLEAGKLEQPGIDAVAIRLARFHDECRSDAEARRYGELSVIEGNVRENFGQAGKALESYLTAGQVAELESWQLSFLRENAGLFEDRVRAGRVRDGHGDLRLEQFYLIDGKPVILDCIEFNDRFRYGDVCSDLAFLSMDLAFRGRVDLAERLLATYARESNDYDLFRLADFYESYRAFVRAKIAIFVKAARDARRYLLLALSGPRPPLGRPSLTAVGGLPASGKSTLADWLGGRLSAPIVESDRTRKHLAGVAPTASLGSAAFAGSYSAEFTERVYKELLGRADAVLASGRPAVLDANFPTARHREQARALARARGVPFRFVECQAPPALCLERLRRRESQPGISDARAGIFEELRARYEPVRELAEDERLRVDTSRPEEELHQAMEAALPLWPRGSG